jgi:hypothetical protein
MEPLDFWRLCDEVSVVQAALLIVGEDPAGSQEYVDRNNQQDRPRGYDAAKTALMNAIIGKRLPATIVELEDNMGRSEGETDWHRTTPAAGCAGRCR